jgi:hypothetical protein
MKRNTLSHSRLVSLDRLQAVLQSSNSQPERIAYLIADRIIRAELLALSLDVGRA